MYRITSNTVARNVLADLNANTQRLSRTQNQLSSGKLLSRPSDDPAAVGRAMQFRKDIEATQQYQRNASEAQGWTDVTDSALTSINDALQRVREITVKGASGTSGPNERRAMRVELEGLVDTIKIAGNANYGGRYVFSGSMTDTKPYTVGADDAYAGDQVDVLREIGPGVAVAVNVDGKEVIGDETGGLLVSIRTIMGHMDAGDTTAISSSLGTLDAHLDTLNAVRATIGATSNRIDIGTARLAEYEGTALQLLNDTESIDLAQTMIEFTIAQNAMQAGLKAGANIVQNSLLDFLR
jgi:flagellar hook-associated protein 3 FlgL